MLLYYSWIIKSTLFAASYYLFIDYSVCFCVNYEFVLHKHILFCVMFFRAVEKLLVKAGDNLNVVKSDGFTTLHIAAINDHREIAKLP